MENFNLINQLQMIKDHQKYDDRMFNNIEEKMSNLEKKVEKNGRFKCDRESHRTNRVGQFHGHCTQSQRKTENLSRSSKFEQVHSERALQNAYQR